MSRSPSEFGSSDAQPIAVSLGKSIDLPILPADSLAPRAPGAIDFQPPKKTRLFTGLDIGTTKVCAIIGEIDPSGQTTVKGLASTPSQGLQRGVVMNLDETIHSIRSAIQHAEEIARVSVRDVLVGIAGSHIQTHNVLHTIKIQNPERGISKSDVKKVVDRAVASVASADREVVQVVTQRFLIDDGEVSRPVGVSSHELSVEVLVVTAAMSSAQNIVRAVKQAGYHTSGIYLEPLASSLAVLTPEERNLGVLVVDIGGGTSDIALWAHGAVRFTGSVPFGGDSITEDISSVLKISRYDAENLKKRFGGCDLDSPNLDQEIEVPLAVTGAMTKVNRRLLCEIIESRLAEIMELCVENCRRSRYFDPNNLGGIILTGGAALTDGLAGLGERTFQLPCKVGVPMGLKGLASIADSPIYSTGVGLVRYGLKHEHDLDFSEANLFSRLMGFFKRSIEWY
ncbi:MAG: cell division protein FtsA [Sumerlaeia bacterium]